MNALAGFLGLLGQLLLKMVGPIAGYIVGKRSARADATEEALERSRERNDIDDEVASLSDADLRDRL